MLSDTSCPECGGVCVQDREHLEHQFAVPQEAPIEARMWKCTKCRMRWTYSMMLTFQKEKENGRDQESS